jgi:cation transporter-like permease
VCVIETVSEAHRLFYSLVMNMIGLAVIILGALVSTAFLSDHIRRATPSLSETVHLMRGKGWQGGILSLCVGAFIAGVVAENMSESTSSLEQILVTVLVVKMLIWMSFVLKYGNDNVAAR